MDAPDSPLQAALLPTLSPQATALRMAPRAPSGHFDEWRGLTTPTSTAAPAEDPLSPPWSQFMDHLGHEGFSDLDRRTQTLARQIRDNGVSYNVYADNSGPQRPWSLDLFPLLITPQSWQRIQTGVHQRVRLLNAIMGDALEALRIVAILCVPAIPTTAQMVWERIGLTGDVSHERIPASVSWGLYPAGLTVEKGEPLFPRKAK